MLISILLGGLYCILIISYFVGFHRTKEIVFSSDYITSTPLSIIIPCRIMDNLDPLTSLIKQLQYQSNRTYKIQIIVVNDFSNKDILLDNVAIFSLKNERPSLNNTKNNKKEAIELGVFHATFDYIACIDADVRISDTWLQNILEFIDNFRPSFAAGIHRYEASKGFLGTFLGIEQDNLSSISIGSLKSGLPTMCNGANMLFSKSKFEKVNGYVGLYDINGGDDMLLYHRIYAKYKKSTYYIKSLSCAVYTAPADTLNALFKQRSRWISKSLQYERIDVSLQLFLVFLVNIWFLICIGLSFLASWFILFVCLKFLIDLVFLYSQHRFFGNKSTLLSLAILVFFYPFYILTVSFASFRKITIPSTT